MGLRTGDLKDLVDNVFEVDSYKSKMGNDRDIVTLSFTVKNKAPADDLVEFIEKGYDFVLDADATQGELRDGKYRVFVELERGRDSVNNIMELADGVKKLSALKKLRFRYYKDFKGQDLSDDALSEMLPLDSDAYDITVNESNLRNYKNFFNRGFIDSVHLVETTLTIGKVYNAPLQFKVIDFGLHQDIQESINETINVDDFSEIISLTKYIGDYNITKYGNNLTLDNGDYTLVVQRIKEF